ncbi:hypothetical protein R70723_20575 [Paenibacillus sp. FSL R7-0273]|uniref:hypothetical protein n=1 Tax=Paenibacillus sp. FSL R7-0273 TaxID=1536772 RepID=UPI0004F60860|nr:hypothetical protein [Paenibacillus sp. FSL R7-0273]AIQ48031.1 hypothetical protein R70723_20575 [Paenibacillus sp. FSL R7-0273]OMF84691.1 hypothetical protein BK144_29420 [Paenibacillus sp. FSL R7-0273]
MRQFMIGQYGGFDKEKYRKDFRSGFYGIEACMFASEEDRAILADAAKSRGFAIGVHFPFRKDSTKLRDPLVLSADDEVRADAFAHITGELDYLAAIKPEYVLFHYPKPVILDERVDWTGWRFGDRREYIYEHDITPDELIIRTEQLFQWLDVQGRKYQFIPVLEFDAISRLTYEHDFLEQLLLKYPGIRLCQDTARLFLQDKLDRRFDARTVLQTYTKYAYLIHLSNVQILDSVQNSHYPVLPELDEAGGWAPIEAYLRIIRTENPEVRIMFEHRSDLISEEQLERCYAWVNAIINGA